MKYILSIILILSTILFQSQKTNAFLSPSIRSLSSQRSSSSLNDGQIEQIEFKIFPDGRIEETVRGIKGGECHKVTEEINQSLGKVVDSKPTEEMYEQEIVIEQTIDVKNGQTDGNGGGGGWEGASSW